MNNLNEQQCYVLDFILRNDTDSKQPLTYNIIKNECSCFVAETEHNFFKIREVVKDDPRNCFNDIINKAFEKLYRKMGIEWDYFPLVVGNSEYRVQKREKLRIVKSHELSYDEVLIKNSKMMRKIELQLEFPYIMSKIKTNPCFETTHILTLARDSKDDFSDFAYHDNEIISLGDSNYYLTFIEDNGLWNRHIHWTFMNLTIDSKSFTLAPIDSKHMTKEINLYSGPRSRWWLYPELDESIIKRAKNIKEERDLMFAKNLEIVTKKSRRLI